MAQLIKAYLSTEIKPFLSTIGRKNGIAILSLLQKIFAPTTPADYTRAKNDFSSLTMSHHETVSHFIPRFHKKLVNMNAMAMNTNTPMNNFEVLLSFLDKLERGVTNPDQRVLLLNYRTTCQTWTGPPSHPSH